MSLTVLVLWHFLQATAGTSPGTRCLGANDLRLVGGTEESQLEVRFGERPLGLYVWPTNQFKPYLRELRSLDGLNVLCDAPPDHPHHHGLMYAVRANGVNFWEELTNSGYQRPIRILRREAGRDAHGRPWAAFVQEIHWLVGKDCQLLDSRRAALLLEERRLEFSVDEPRGEVSLEWTSRFEAGPASTKLVLSGTGYNGLGLRLPPSFDRAALHRNSAGLPYSADQRWDVTAARWSTVSPHDESGVPQVTLFAHPANASSGRFFTMILPFTYLAATQNLDKEPLEYNAGSRFELRYMLTVANRPQTSETLNQRLREWEGIAKP